MAVEIALLFNNQQSRLERSAHMAHKSIVCTLRTCDGLEVDVDGPTLARLTENSAIREASHGGLVEVVDTKVETLEQVRDWLELHKHTDAAFLLDDNEDMGDWNIEPRVEVPEIDVKFFSQHLTSAYALLTTANHLGLTLMVKYGAQVIADRIKDQPVEKIREIFGITEPLPTSVALEIENDTRWIRGPKKSEPGKKAKNRAS